MPSNQEKRKQDVRERIQEIYYKSHQNYGAPKITKELQKAGETIAGRTVGKYMREMGIRAQYIKLYTVTTRDSDFSSELITFLMNSSILPNQMLYGAQI